MASALSITPPIISEPRVAGPSGAGSTASARSTDTAMTATLATVSMPGRCRSGIHASSVEALDAALRRSLPALAYLIPDFQNPTGMRMPASTRREIAVLLRRGRTPLLVDETLVDLDRPATDLGCPVFEQLLLAELLDGQHALLAGRLDELCARRAVALDAVHRLCPGWSVQPPGGGLSLWCELDAPGSTRLAVLAVQHGVRVVPGSRFSAHGGLERRLRLPYTLPPDVLTGAVERLALARTAG